MCLSIALHRPDDLLAKGEHLGYEWNIMHNGKGYRCGYIKVPPGHPWFELSYNDVPADVHGGITYSEPDKPCDAAGADNGWWVGFDCAHYMDMADPELMSPKHKSILAKVCGYSKDYSEADDWPGAEIRDQDYVETECRSLCEQAHAAKGEQC